MKYFYFLFVIFLVLCEGFDFLDEPKKQNPDDFLNFGKVYDFEEIKIKQIENATKKLELLKNNNLNIFFNKYFQEMDSNINSFLEMNTNINSFKLGYPDFLYLYSSTSTRIQDYDKHEKMSKFFTYLSNDLSVLYKNESMSLYHSKNEDFNQKMIELNIVPSNVANFVNTSGRYISIYETLLIFQTKNMDFKELIQKKFKNSKNILFSDYYIFISF